ncbi:unnamed protein product [Fraxinus pennsylvanica]|uniref:Mur ligase central domain-containing protein n=1 Tax=Fraxinus pennsylvanica TaxID=56036 RepID=A0AAD2AGV8_9LAMI|nr:unnamed protein product [Fraxinus pennsylvanica]
MIALALESIRTVYQSHGNWNNEVGVSLTFIGIPRNVGFGVLELGRSKNVRVILNAGASHLENFASLEEVLMAKGEILRDAMQGDICVLNADDPLITSLPIPMGVKKVGEILTLNF